MHRWGNAQILHVEFEEELLADEIQVCCMTGYLWWEQVEWAGEYYLVASNSQLTPDEALALVVSWADSREMAQNGS